MSNNNYIAAIEIGSSKISGAVGVKTYEGIKVAAYASEPVNGFIAKGVVKNVDATGNSLTSLVNRLESQLEGEAIEMAYIAFGGTSLKSINSVVCRDFTEYTKITQEIIDQMAAENDATFATPKGYQKIQVIEQECKLNGDLSTMPIGMHTQHIECNYLNIIIKEQYIKQLEESFNLSAIEIADCYCSARIEGDILLQEEEKRTGCALVNIGSETTTILIYTNNLLRKIVVIPLGSDNITKDLSNEDIPYQEAEQLKIFKGYNSKNDEKSPISTEQTDLIISARMTEILQNVKYQIENSGCMINRLIFSGGGSKLKNIITLIEDNIPNIKTRIATELPQTVNSEERLILTKDTISPTLFGLLNIGKENCCKVANEPITTEIPETLPFPNENDADVSTALHEQQQKEEPSKNDTQKATKKKKERSFIGMGDLFNSVRDTAKSFVDRITQDTDDDNYTIDE